MVRYKNALVTVAKKTSERNSEGSFIESFDFENPLAVFRSDVQPAKLSAAEIDLYGINADNAETQKVFIDGITATFDKGDRAKVQFDNGRERLYTVQPLNEWRNHSEFLLIPIAGA